MPDGNVHDHYLGYVQNVVAGQALAELIPLDETHAGKIASGKEHPHSGRIEKHKKAAKKELKSSEAPAIAGNALEHDIPGQTHIDPRYLYDNPIFPLGPNCGHDPSNPNRIIALVSGYCFYNKGLITVKKLLNVRQDINFSTGNILFAGDVVVHGDIYPGCNNNTGESGHMVIVKDGLLCTCGRRGCWEAYSSATGLINMTKDKLASTRDTSMHKWVEENDGKVSGRTAFVAARRNDKAGLEIVAEYIDYLVCGITNIINIFQPEIFCIGGGICNEGDYLIKPLAEKVDKEQYTRDNAKKTQLKVASLGNDAGIIGAAVLAE